MNFRFQRSIKFQNLKNITLVKTNLDQPLEKHWNVQKLPYLFEKPIPKNSKFSRKTKNFTYNNKFTKMSCRVPADTNPVLSCPGTRKTTGEATVFLAHRTPAQWRMC